MVGDNNEDVWIVSDVPTRVDVVHCLIETLKKVACRFLLALPVDIKYVMRRVTCSTSEKTSFLD